MVSKIKSAVLTTAMVLAVIYVTRKVPVVNKFVNTALAG